MPTAGKEQAMSAIPPHPARHLPVSRGACSFHSENQNPADGFQQSVDEFELDISPRSKVELLATIDRIDCSHMEPETADFLRGYLVGRFEPINRESK